MTNVIPLHSPEELPTSEDFRQGQLHELGRFALWCEEKTRLYELTQYMQELLGSYVKQGIAIVEEQGNG